MRCLKRLTLQSSAVTVTSLCVFLSHPSCEKLKSLFSARDINRIKHDLLHPNELPRAGMLVAIDAEFVSMQQEETELRSDGSKKVIRPARLSLARVSVLRGDGPKAGVPFIDDHIHTSEMIVDYLTEWSGIKCRYEFARSVTFAHGLLGIDGDLDPHLSPHTLTPLKIVYKKLRTLVDRGCIFIGHGLSKDFRIISEYRANFAQQCILIGGQTSLSHPNRLSILWICISSRLANEG